MNKSILALRVVYMIIIVTLTVCYLFGDIIQVWNNWISGLIYGLALSGLIETHSNRRRMNSSVLWRRRFCLFILVALTLYYIFAASLTWRDWFSGLAYGFALNGLMATLEPRRGKRRIS